MVELKRALKILKYRDRIYMDTKYPVSIQACLTDYCYNTCVMCRHDRTSGKQMNFYDWTKFIKIGSIYGLETVNYVGVGDSIAYGNINSVMGYHIKLGIDFSFITAGYVPNNVDMELLSKSRWIRVSLDAVSDSVYKKVRGGIPVAKVLASIDKMIESGCNVELEPTISNVNIYDLENLSKYAESKGLPIKFKRAIHFDDIDGIDYSLFSDNEKSESFNKCVVPYYCLFIRTDGNIYPCCLTGGGHLDKPVMNPLGNISDDYCQISKAMYQFRILNKEQRPKICADCLVHHSQINKVNEDFKLISVSDKNFF